MARWKAIPVAGLAALIVGTALFSTQYRTASAAPSAAIATDLSLSLDCDTATAGIQASCNPAPGAFDIAVVLTNNSAGSVTLSAVNFDLVGDNKPNFTPTAAVANTAGLAPLICNSPPPTLDTDLVTDAPNVSRSRFICFTGGTGPTIPSLGSLLLGTVSYMRTGAVQGIFTLEQVSLTDNGFFELGSCNPVIEVLIDCFGATVTGTVPTPTSTSTAVPTATPSPTPCAGTCPPTATTTTIKGVTVTPTPGTPTVSPPPTVADGGSPTTAAPGVNPPPPGTGPGGNAGAGGARPIRLPDTGSDGGSANRNSIALLALFALVAGGLAGGAYLGTTKLSSARRRQDED